MSNPQNNPQTASLSEKIALRRAQRVSTAPISAQNLLERVYARKASPRACVKAFCLECVGFERLAVTECTAYACPLWNIRPYQVKRTKLKPNNEGDK